jgi:hypothetical protein
MFRGFAGSLMLAGSRGRHTLLGGLAGGATLSDQAPLEPFVLGGFLSALYESQPETLETALREQLMPPIAEALELSRGTLGVDRLLVGAAQLAFEPMLDDPLEFALPIY